MKNLVVVLSMLSMYGCGSEPVGQVPTVIEGKDYSGVYRLDGLACYDSQVLVLKSLADFSMTTPVETISITGNDMVGDFSSSSCAFKIKSRVVFEQTSLTAIGETVGSVKFSQIVTTTTTQTSCGYTTTLINNTGLPVVPTSANGTAVHNQMQADFTGTYVRTIDGALVGLFSTFQVQSQPTYLCFKIYVRL